MSAPVIWRSSAPALGIEADIGPAHLWIHPEGGAWFAHVWLGAWEHPTKRHATSADAQRAALTMAHEEIDRAQHTAY